MVAWFFVTFIMIALPRLLFSPAQILPYFVQLDPGCALIPVCGIVFGVAGAWGVFAAIIGVDLFTELTLSLSLFTATGGFLFAYSASLLWRRFDLASLKELNAWKFAIRFLLCALPGSAIMAVWIGFGSECMRLYPFPYVALLILIQNLLFVPLLGIPIMRVFMDRVLLVRPEEQSLPAREKARLFVFCIRAGAWGGLLAGIFLASKVYHIQPLAPFIIGVTDCPWVIAGVTPFLFLQLYGLFGRRKKNSAGQRKG